LYSHFTNWSTHPEIINSAILRLVITSNSAYYSYSKLWILRYPGHRYHTVPSPGFEPTTLWLRVRHPNHSATMHHAQQLEIGVNKSGRNIFAILIVHEISLFNFSV
jgi:hypothetical protein